MQSKTLNIIQYQSILQVTQHRQRANPNAAKQILSQVKANLTSNQQQDPAVNRFDCCHHCRMMFRDDYLMTCNYRSGTMGLPIINSSITDSYVFAQSNTIYCIILKWRTTLLQTADSLPTERGAFIVFTLKKVFIIQLTILQDGELICNRKFCRLCLKQNYEFNLADTNQRNDWVCPFCQVYISFVNHFKGVCYCQRCQRNDIILKLKGMYMINGGDLQELSKESLFEKYVRSQADDFFYKKKASNIGFQVFTCFSMKKRTGYQYFKQQFETFRYMQSVRLDFEHLRLIYSSLMKREKVKLKQFQNSLEIWLQRKYLKGLSMQKELQQQEVISIQRSSTTSSDSSSESFVAESYEPSKKKKKLEKINEKQERLKRAQSLLKHIYKQPNTMHNPNSPPEDMPKKKLKREVTQLLCQHDAKTYDLVVKKLKEDFKHR